MQEKGCTFIYGPHEGLEFELPQAGEWMIGRDTEAELHLQDDLISRQHVRLAFGPESLELVDLGSTNGTFVNGYRVRQCQLECGDHIVVGKHILKIVAKEHLSNSGLGINSPALIRQFLTQGKTGSSLAESVDLSAVPLAGFLQLLGIVKYTGRVLLHGASRGRLMFEEGQLLSASVNEELHLSPEQALEKILRSADGHLKLDDVSDDAKHVEHFRETTAQLIEQIVDEQKKIKHLWSELPLPEEILVLAKPLPIDLGTLSANHIRVVQLVHDFGRITKMLDQSPLKEFECLEGLKNLLQKGIVKVGTNS